jgi:hypothetical protein
MSENAKLATLRSDLDRHIPSQAYEVACTKPGPSRNESSNHPLRLASLRSLQHPIAHCASQRLPRAGKITVRLRLCYPDTTHRERAQRSARSVTFEHKQPGGFVGSTVSAGGRGSGPSCPVCIVTATSETFGLVEDRPGTNAELGVARQRVGLSICRLLAFGDPPSTVVDEAIVGSAAGRARLVR